jgi:DNA polymerase V
MVAENEDWQEYGINRGDILVIDRSLTPKKSSLVTVVENGEFALCRLADAAGQIELWGTVLWIVKKVEAGRG